MSKRFSNLLSVFLKIDYRDKNNSGKKKVVGIILAYLISNTFLSMNYFKAFDEQSFIVLSFSTNAFLLSFIVLNDFSNLFFSKSHIDTISSLPVSNSELFLSKFTSAILYISFFSLAVLIPQLVFFNLYEGDILKTVLYLMVNLLFSYFLIGVILLIYTTAFFFLTEKANVVLYFLQFTFFVFVMYSSSLTSQAVTLGKRSLMTYSVIQYLPQSFFANSLNNSLDFLLCFSFTIFVYVSFFVLIGNNYQLIAEKVYNIKKRTIDRKSISLLKNINDFIYKNLLRNNLERASYNLVREQLRNSRNLRLKYIPIAFIPVVICMIGVFTNATDFLVLEHTNKSLLYLTTGLLILSPSITFTLIMCSRLLITNTKIADENTGDIEWIYDSLPIESKSLFLNGTLKFVNFNFIIPVVLLITFFLLIRIEAIPIVLNVMYITAFLFFINSILKLVDKRYPFTLESTKFNSASKFLEILFTLILGIVVFICQIFIFQNVIFVIISIVILTGLTVIFGKIKSA